MDETGYAAYREIPYGTAAFEEAVALRHALLREPLDLSFSSHELLAESDSIHLVCELGGSIIACVVLKPLFSGQMRMRQLAVSREWQGKGIGSRLVLYAEEVARARDLCDMVLHARETAVVFYEKLGYATQGTWFVEVTIPHIAMCKDLAAE